MKNKPLAESKIDQFLKVLRWRDQLLRSYRPDLKTIMPMAELAIDEAHNDNSPWLGP